MNFKKPKFWDYKKPNFIAYLLFPISLLVTVNNFLLNIYPKKKFNEIKTICVGNIYLGGTGKTPTTLKLLELLKGLNLKIATAKKNYSHQRDEEILLKKKSNLIISKKRSDIIAKAIKKGIDLVIFDDGLQEKKIDYDVKFVCFDCKSWIGNGFLIPSGPLREKIKSLMKYDGVFLKSSIKDFNSSDISSRIKNINPEIEIFNSYISIKNINKFDLSDKFIIFSGIGNSSSFKETLVNNNFNITKEIFFPAHHEYKLEEISKILNFAKKEKAKILTTEKDYVKIPENLKDKINYIEIDLEIEEKDKLINLIKTKINETY
jgi:tetraacyldisaccharide 4'-kinase